MPGATERIDAIPPSYAEVESIFLYGVDLREDKAEGEETAQRVLAFGFCFEGHCYRLSIPAEYHFNGRQPRRAFGCGFGSEPGYQMWKLDKTAQIKRVEKRSGSAVELILEFNLPGRSPASMTYSAKVVLAGNSGKIYE